MKACKLCWTLVVVLAVAVAAFAYKFTVGEVRPSEDGRVAVLLTKDERNALLLEMRTWLQNSQRILAVASTNDVGEVVKAARASGMAAEAETPASLFRKIPLEMKTLGFATRRTFDDIANEAEKSGSTSRAAGQLSEAMGNCVACHATYRFVEQ
jgi:mono/diheme cytochrome c family protein